MPTIPPNLASYPMSNIRSGHPLEHFSRLERLRKEQSAFFTLELVRRSSLQANVARGPSSLRETGLWMSELPEPRMNNVHVCDRP